MNRQWWRSWRRGSRIPVSALSLVRHLPSTWRSRCSLVPQVCQIVTLAAIVLAALDPVRARSSLVPGGLDLMVLLDVSSSMRGMDLDPDRLARGKALVEQVVAARTHDRVGLLLFAGDYALACPLTIDRAALLTRLREVEASDGNGTAVGAAVVGALDSLRRARVSAGALLLVTDGVSTRAGIDPLDAAARAFESSTPIVVLQTGDGGSVPMPTSFGAIEVDTDDPSGSLEAIARRSGGTVISARPETAGAELMSAFERLATRVSRQTYTRWERTGGVWATVAAFAFAAHILSAGVLRLQR